LPFWERSRVKPNPADAGDLWPLDFLAFEVPKAPAWVAPVATLAAVDARASVAYSSPAVIVDATDGVLLSILVAPRLIQTSGFVVGAA
jgi:hypothetical protein